MLEIGKVLDTNAQLVCRRLGESKIMASSFYLAGGTTLALQLGHRRSLDLDFFQKGDAERISFNRIARELKHLFGESRFKISLKQIDQAVWNIAGTKVTFLAYPFPLLYPLVEGATISPVLAGISLAGPREIAAMKAYALGRRATFRDYVDLYFLLRNGHVTLGEIIRDAGRKFVVAGKAVFSAKLFLEQLNYTADVDDKEVTLNLMSDGKLTSAEIQDFFREQVRSFLESETTQQRGDLP
ncbi:MAG: nucleotidyl transferase AbiEii/AbiGii toxin family protein [Firmicutes bacterium]|nr:nucleotidyl transferase AbiEii/AbiGii toxin family protein [Bacillota bacterium]